MTMKGGILNLYSSPTTAAGGGKIGEIEEGGTFESFYSSLENE